MSAAIDIGAVNTPSIDIGAIQSAFSGAQIIVPTAVASQQNVPAPNIIGGRTIQTYNLPWVLNPILAQ